jgi:hypothetical protein
MFYQNKLNKLSFNYVEEFKSILGDNPRFEYKGIFFSEMLSIYSIIKEYKIGYIIESGRARGQSTEILCKIAKIIDIKVLSIEFDRNSPDVKIAEERLREFKRVLSLQFGDSNSIISNFRKPSINTLVLIDGPKGLKALELAIKCFQLDEVKFVAIHDSHRGASNLRPIIEKCFPSFHCTTDDYEFVDQFSFLDEACWEETANHHSNASPYNQNGKDRSLSYAGTLTIIAKPPIENIEICTHIVDKKIQIRNSFLYKLLLKFKIVSILRRIYFLIQL